MTDQEIIQGLIERNTHLPDSEKEYDRLTGLDTIKLVKKLGFEIIKRK